MLHDEANGFLAFPGNSLNRVSYGIMLCKFLNLRR